MSGHCSWFLAFILSGWISTTLWLGFGLYIIKLKQRWTLWLILGLYIIGLKHEWMLLLVFGLYIIKLKHEWTLILGLCIIKFKHTHTHTHTHTLSTSFVHESIKFGLSLSLSLSPHLNNTHSGQGMPWGTPWQCLRGCWRRLCTNSECTEWWPLQTSTAGCCSGWRHCGSSETARRPKTDHIKIFMDTIHTVMTHQRNGSYALPPWYCCEYNQEMTIT